jgi:hypothetical protein
MGGSTIEEKDPMNDQFRPPLVALWIERVYFLNENWDRLRTIGKVKALHDIDEVVFFPVRQRLPALDEQTHPEMKDPATAQLLSSFNSVGDACDFMNEPYRCHLQHVSSEELGKKLKYLLRKSNDTYPHLFSDVVEVPSHFSILDGAPNKNPYFSYIPVIDVHAYENSILIAGGPLARASDWPKGFRVKEIDYSDHWSFRGKAAENIILPSTVTHQELGEVVKAVWQAKKDSLSSMSK